MVRVLKFFGWLVFGFVVLLVLATLALNILFDPNEYKAEIEQKFQVKTGRELTIDGDIAFALFPRFAIEVGSTRLANAPGFGDEPMVSFGNASFSLGVWDTIVNRKLEIGVASIDSLRVNLAVDGSGASNWGDLVAAVGESPPSPPSAEEASATDGKINAELIRIRDARLSLVDATTGEAILIEDAGLEIGRLRMDGTPFPVQAGLAFELAPAGIGGTLDLATVVMFNADSGVLALDGLTLGGSLEGVANIPTEVSLQTEGIEVLTKESRLSMQTLELKGLDMRVVADLEPLSYAGEVLPKAAIRIDRFSPRTLMQLFDVAPPETADPSALSIVALEAKAELTSTAMELRDVVIQLDDTTFRGGLSVPSGDSGPIRFELVGDSIQLARYMAPGDAPAASEASAPVEIPVDLIRGLQANGRFEMQRVSLGKLNFDNIEVGLNAGGDKLRIYPVSADLFGGSYQGDVRIDASGSAAALSLDEKISGVNLAELARALFEQDNVTGRIEGAFKLSGRGEDMAAIQENLSGTMALSLTDGAFQGADVWYELRRARAALKGEPAPTPKLPAKTDFNSLRVTGVVKEGVFSSDDLFVELPFMQLSGAGTVNIPAATVDYALSARVLERPEFMQNATPEEIADFTEVVVPLKVSGPLAAPRLRPDLEKLVRDQVEEEIKDKLKDKLKGLFD